VSRVASSEIQWSLVCAVLNDIRSTNRLAGSPQEKNVGRRVSTFWDGDGEWFTAQARRR
jgi:hypothetical protein